MRIGGGVVEMFFLFVDGGVTVAVLVVWCWCGCGSSSVAVVM